MALLMYEKWVRLAEPLHSKMIIDRIKLARLAKIRIRFAKRVRDRNLRQWVKYKV